MKEGNIRRISSVLCNAVWPRSAKHFFHIKKKLETKFDPQIGDPSVPSIPSRSRDFESLVQSLPLVGSVKFGT